MASFLYDEFRLCLGGAPTHSAVDWNTDTIEAFFVDEADDTPNQTTDVDAADRAAASQVPAFASAPTMTCSSAIDSNVLNAASIVYAYLRLEQRELTKVPERGVLWRMGFRSALYTSFNFASSLTLGLVSVFPRFLFIPYLVQWLETMWGITHPAIGWKPTHIGVRQLIVSVLWTVLFITFWKP